MEREQTPGVAYVGFPGQSLPFLKIHSPFFDSRIPAPGNTVYTTRRFAMVWTQRHSVWFGPCWTAHKTVQRMTASAAGASLPRFPVPFQAPKSLGLSELYWMHGRPAAGGQEGCPGASQTTLDASV